MKKILLFTIFSFNLFAQNNNIIPAPVKYVQVSDAFMLDNKVFIDVLTEDAELKRLAQVFADMMSSNYQKIQFKKIETPTQENKPVYFELLKTQDPSLGNEGYVLEVNAFSIKFSANQNAGIFNAIQTFRQLLFPQFENKQYGSPLTMIPCCKITDYPRFAWRGIMLDVSRHFFTKEEVKQYIDLMARYKFNVLHWHLTDDEGWRIEIKSLPKLTEVGAWRVERHGRFGENREYPKPNEKATVGGFYTQEEIKEVIKYASDRNITVVPEIDIPGHSMATLAAYPELSCKKEPKFVNPGSKFAEWFGDGKFKMLIENTLNPSDEKVYDFLDKVFTEVAALFPSKYIHVGGDEAYHGFWEADKGCQDLMKKNKLKDTHELQSYFMKRVEKIVSSKGKKMIGWDEILEGGLAEGAAVMSWRGMKGGIEAAKQGHEVVMTPTEFCYIDYTQGDNTLENKIYADLSLKKAYSFEPVPEGIDPKLILGGQANLWTEVIPTLRYATYMTYPRAFATAETLWSQKEKKEWNNFMNRVENHFQRFDEGQLSISKAALDPIVSTKKDGDKLICTISSDIQSVELFYTIDNTFPDKFSKKYTESFEIPKGDLSLKVVAYRNGQPIGRQLSIPRAELLRRAK